MNGVGDRNINIPLKFLRSDRNYKAIIVEDQISESAAVNIKHSTLKRNDVINLNLTSGGGYVAMFTLD